MSWFMYLPPLKALACQTDNFFINTINNVTMQHQVTKIEDLIAGSVISTNPGKCETCVNDANGCNCVKIDIYGGQLCIETHKA